MTTTNLTRRTALLGTVTLPAALAPLGMAQAATTANATDAAWAALLPYRAEVDAMNAGNARGVYMSDEKANAVLDRYNEAFDALMDTPVASLTDVERKLAASEHYYRGSVVPHELLDDLLADVRRRNGRAA